MSHVTSEKGGSNKTNFALGQNFNLVRFHFMTSGINSVKKFKGPHFFDFPESQRIVGKKEENFQDSGCESRILENIALLGWSVAPDT